MLLHFLEDYGRNGRAVQGFPNIGIVSQGMESLALRRYFGLAPHEQVRLSVLLFAFPNIGIVSHGMEALALQRFFGLAPYQQVRGCPRVPG